MDSFVRMDKGDVEMVDAEKNVRASDGLVSNESPVKYENGVKTEGSDSKNNAENKTDDQSDSKGEDPKNAGSETEDQLNSKSQPEAHDNLVSEEKNSSQVPNDMIVDIQEDPQMITYPTSVTTDGDARSYEFPKVKNEVTDSSIGKTPEPAIPMFLTEPSAAKSGQHSGEASENISAMMADGEDDEGSPEDQAAFIGKLGTFYREKAMEFKPPKFYGHPLNCLKLWRSVIRLGGYDRVTGSKLWRQVGESFNPPKTCTTVSWTFRNFYDKVLLQYERHRTQNGMLELPIAPPPASSGVDNEGSGYQTSASGRAVRDSAARAMLGWHEQRTLGYGEVGEPIVKDRRANNTPKRAKSLKNVGSLKHQGQNEVEHPMKAAGTETSKQLDAPVLDVGPPADWVKINVRETKDSFEVYALVPGLLREEVRVQSDRAGRLVITGQPNQLDNPWGVTAFKKVVTLPARIDPLLTNAVVSVHGCLHVHVPFAQQNI